MTPTSGGLGRSGSRYSPLFGDAPGPAHRYVPVDNARMQVLEASMERGRGYADLRTCGFAARLAGF